MFNLIVGIFLMTLVNALAQSKNVFFYDLGSERSVAITINLDKKNAKTHIDIQA